MDGRRGRGEITAKVLTSRLATVVKELGHPLCDEDHAGWQ